MGSLCGRRVVSSDQAGLGLLLSVGETGQSQPFPTKCPKNPAESTSQKKSKALFFRRKIRMQYWLTRGHRWCLLSHILPSSSPLSAFYQLCHRQSPTQGPHCWDWLLLKEANSWTRAASASWAKTGRGLHLRPLKEVRSPKTK